LKKKEDWKAPPFFVYNFEISKNLSMKRSRLIYVLILLTTSIMMSSCKTSHHIAVNHHNTAHNTGHNTNSNSNNSLNSNIASKYRLYSDKLGVTFKGSEDLKLVSCLSEWLGTPYKYGGNTRQGTDCSGMVSAVFKEVYNINMYRNSADQLKNVKVIDKSELRAGDLVFFKIYNDTISHVGIYLGENKFIHSSTRKGVVVNSLEEDYYKKCYFTSGRVVGMPQ